MKSSLIKPFWLVLPLLVLASFPAKAVDLKGNYTDVSVEVYSWDGALQEGTGKPLLNLSRGTLFLDQGYIPFSSGPGGVWQGDVATLNAIDGKPVMTLSVWIILNDATKVAGLPDSMEYFPRSAETYSINGAPYVTISVNPPGGGNGGVGRPTINISAVQPTASEGGNVPGRFLIALDAATGRNIKVVYTVSGKARNGKDYQKIAKKVLIPAGNVSAFVDIQPLDDNQAEGTEAVTLKLTKTKAYRVGAKSATVTITDND